MKNTMKNAALLMTFALATVLGTSACDQKKAEKAETVAAVEKAPMAMPAADDANGWKLYITEQIQKYSQGLDGRPYAYILPSSTTMDDVEFNDLFQRQLEQVQTVLMSGVQSGNMLVFASPESPRMADLIVQAFQVADKGTMKGVRVLFIGQPEERAIAQAAVEPSGAEFVFHHAK